MKHIVISLLLVTLAGAFVAGAPYPQPDPHPFPQDDHHEESYEDSHENHHVREKRQLVGGFDVAHSPFGKDYRANLGYNRVFNRGRTSIGGSAFKSWGVGGKSHGFGINFSHKFG